MDPPVGIRKTLDTLDGGDCRHHSDRGCRNLSHPLDRERHVVDGKETTVGLLQVIYRDHTHTTRLRAPWGGRQGRTPLRPGSNGKTSSDVSLPRTPLLRDRHRAAHRRSVRSGQGRRRGGQEHQRLTSHVLAWNKIPEALAFALNRPADGDRVGRGAPPAPSPSTESPSPPFGCSDHRGSAGEHQDRGPSHCAAGRWAHRRDRSRQRPHQQELRSQGSGSGDRPSAW